MALWAKLRPAFEERPPMGVAVGGTAHNGR